MQQTCNDCMFAFFVDHGYSNYTVEGTSFHCGLDKHPAGSFDRWYGQDTRLYYASRCHYFLAGQPVEMDVDHDTLHDGKMTLAQRMLWDRRVKDLPDAPEEKKDAKC